MQKLRLVPLAILSLSVGLMTACDSTSSSTVPTIDRVGLDDIASTSLVAGQGSTTIHSTVTSEAAGFSIAFTITDSTGADKTSNFTINFTVPSSSATKWVAVDQNATLAAKSGITNGTYTLTLTATSSSGSNHATTTFIVTGGTASGSGSSTTTLTKTGTADLGAQAASAGSFLSIAGGWSMTSGEKTTADEDSVDIVFFASTNSSSGTPTFYSPAAAYSAGLGSLSGWTTRHSTIIVSNGTAALSTKEAVVAAIGTAATQSATVTQGNWYAVKLDNGTYGSIYVSSLSNSGNASTAEVYTYK